RRDGRLPCFGEQALEVGDVDAVLLELEPIAGRLRQQPLRTEELAQPRHVTVERRRRSLRRTVGPERLQQPIARDDFSCVQEQQSEQRSLLAARQLQLPTLVVSNHQRPKQQELPHPSRGRPPAPPILAPQPTNPTGLLTRVELAR